jgi:hypothetical protein
MEMAPFRKSSTDRLHDIPIPGSDGTTSLLYLLPRLLCADREHNSVVECRNIAEF